MQIKKARDHDPYGAATMNRQKDGYIMSVIERAVIAASLIWALPVFGQTAQDHEAHHPDGPAATQQQPAQPASSAQAGRAGSGMMGGGAMPGSMMGGNMRGPGQTDRAGMMPMTNMMTGSQFGAAHVEGRLAFVKAELKITDGQAQQWNAFADAVRVNAGSMSEMRSSMMSGQDGPSALPERLAREDKLVTAHLAAIKRTEDAVAQLYAALTDEQKKVADTIMLGPMGMLMGMR